MSNPLSVDFIDLGASSVPAVHSRKLQEQDDFVALAHDDFEYFSTLSTKELIKKSRGMSVLPPLSN